jgi:hypothetical protein
MATFFASSAAGGNGSRLDWTLDFDDTANTATVNATHTHFDGSPSPDPQQAALTFRLNTGQSITVDLLTGLLSTGAPFDGTASTMINTGPRTRTNVKLSVSNDRAKLITYSTTYLPPA